MSKPTDFTLCSKVDKLIRALEQTAKTGELDVPGFANELHRIRKDAQRMESGLKRRKKIMIERNLEVEYQKQKTQDLTPQGINNLRNNDTIQFGQLKFEVTIKNGQEIIYQNLVGAGVMCAVERIDDMDEMGNLDGQTQVFVFGRPMAYWYAFDQLRQGMEAKNMEVMNDLVIALRNNKLVDPEVRKEIARAINKTL